MTRRSKKRLLAAVRRYTVFFIIMAFVITCCMVLFITLFQAAADIELTKENMHLAAVLTFGNVILLSIAFTVIDGICRRYTVERPIKRIISAAEKIMQGDFSVRIKPLVGFDDDGFNAIINCFNKMAEELSGIETLRTDFIANVSHELKTPLAVIQNYGTMLTQPDLSEEKRMEYAKAITDTSRKLANLITNILKLNKLENQQIYPVSKPYNLSEQLCECLLSFEDAWERKNLDIETDIEEDIMINADAEMLSLVWNNLFSNAVKFTDMNGKISVSLKKENGIAEVSVSDTGCGMSAETGRHIFEKFYQGDTSHAAKGNGLGLSLVKRIVDITNCEISVQSELQKGSTFTVKLRCNENETV